ncbi:cobalamin B12-binding domain-containing protein [Paenibacillus hamazuiensis]|uniref:cobalamin B12-binding domain-containing protein n=1 Tax=Paenibacillus hamazuiensis TaxID=2936508 RepID=UPI00200F5A29|nr:cobalamin-dependent protein [Paenibacillus hamazuiensis]
MNLSGCKRRILLAPLDPVHDVGLKIIRRGLDEAGHDTTLLPPDLAVHEIAERAVREPFDCIMLSRTIGYGAEELLAEFTKMMETAGLKGRVKIAVGGMGIRPELVEGLGFDRGFGPGTTVEEALAFVENRPARTERVRLHKTKPDLTAGYTYRFLNGRIARLLDDIAQDALRWAERRTTAAVERAQIRELAGVGVLTGNLRAEYAALCDPVIRDYYEKAIIPAAVRMVEEDEVAGLRRFCRTADGNAKGISLRHTRSKPAVLIQYGTGSLFLDASHMKVAEAWGADGVIHFDPAWGARTEGLLEGHVNYEGDGTVITAQNLRLLRSFLGEDTLFQVRAHRGLNTPETVVIAGQIGADLTKINIAYGSLGAGTDPERLAVDGIAALKYAAAYGLPYDIVTNEELCGVPAFKAFAGMLIVCRLGLLLGGRPILQPLFCHSPEAMITRKMEDNYIDFNAAKVQALRQIVDAPVWPGAPIGFMTHSEDRVQSAMTTSLHAALGASLEVDAVTIASSDEAYSRGPITAQARVDTLRAVKESFRFLGRGKVEPTAHAIDLAEELTAGIEAVLEQVREAGFVEALYRGMLGSPEDGAYPGRAGKGTVKHYVF